MPGTKRYQQHLKSNVVVFSHPVPTLLEEGIAMTDVPVLRREIVI